MLKLYVKIPLHEMAAIVCNWMRNQWMYIDLEQACYRYACWREMHSGYDCQAWVHCLHTKRVCRMHVWSITDGAPAAIYTKLHMTYRQLQEEM